MDRHIGMDRPDQVQPGDVVQVGVRLQHFREAVLASIQVRNDLSSAAEEAPQSTIAACLVDVHARMYWFMAN